jgi:hypothetical protein
MTPDNEMLLQAFQSEYSSMRYPSNIRVGEPLANHLKDGPVASRVLNTWCFDEDNPTSKNLMVQNSMGLNNIVFRIESIFGAFSWLPSEGIDHLVV